ncbi:MAG: hypothetical protein ACK4PR_08035, partial [Gammaproteobacteria bacterium]
MPSSPTITRNSTIPTVLTTPRPSHRTIILSSNPEGNPSDVSSSKSPATDTSKDLLENKPSDETSPGNVNSTEVSQNPTPMPTNDNNEDDVSCEIYAEGFESLVKNLNTENVKEQHTTEASKNSTPILPVTDKGNLKSSNTPNNNDNEEYREIWVDGAEKNLYTENVPSYPNNNLTPDTNNSNKESVLDVIIPIEEIKKNEAPPLAHSELSPKVNDPSSTAYAEFHDTSEHPNFKDLEDPDRDPNDDLNPEVSYALLSPEEFAKQLKALASNQPSVKLIDIKDEVYYAFLYGYFIFAGGLVTLAAWSNYKCNDDAVHELNYSLLFNLLGIMANPAFINTLGRISGTLGFINNEYLNLFGIFNTESKMIQIKEAFRQKSAYRLWYAVALVFCFLCAATNGYSNAQSTNNKIYTFSINFIAVMILQSIFAAISVSKLANMLIADFVHYIWQTTKKVLNYLRNCGSTLNAERKSLRTATPKPEYIRSSNISIYRRMVMRA